MANNTSFAIVTIVSLWLAVLGLCLTGIGLSGALSGDEMETWMRGVMWVMAVSGIFLIIGGYNMFTAAKKKSQDIEKDEKELSQAVAQEVKKPVNMDEAIGNIREEGKKLIPEKNTLLAHWTYNADEWKAYTKKEFRYRTKEAYIIWAGITGLGTLMMAGYRDMGYLAAFITSFITGAFFTLIRLIIANNARKANSSNPGDVIISAKSILINGKYHILNDENKTMTKLELLNNETPQILEFTVEWNTRKGPTNDQVRIPVPDGKAGEAIRLVSVFKDEIIGKY